MHVLGVSGEDMAVITATTPGGTHLGKPLLSRMPKRWCRLVFVNTQRLRSPGTIVRDHIRRVCPNHSIGPYSVREYRQRIREAFYVCEVKFELPHGEEFESKDWLRLETFRTLDGKAMSVSPLSGPMFHELTIMLWEACIERTVLGLCSLVGMLEYRLGLYTLNDDLPKSSERVIREFEDSLVNVISGAYNQYSVDGDAG